MVVYGPSLPTAPKAPATGFEPSKTNQQSAAPGGAGGAAGDPSLWGVLTDEERAFFAQQAELGSLTYRPRGARVEQLEPPKGQRLDVRV